MTDKIWAKGFGNMNAVRRRVALVILFWFLALPAFAACPAVQSDCSSPTYNNLTIKGNHTVTGTLGATGGGSLAGTFTGTPTFSGQARFSSAGNGLIVNNGANVTAGPFALGSNTAAGFLGTINGATGTNRRILGQTAGGTRWELRFASPAAESGGNAGTNFELLPYTDAAASEGTLMSCGRDQYGCTFGNTTLPLASQAQINPLLFLNISLAGSTTAAGQSLFQTTVISDTLTATNSPRDWQLLHNFGGVGFAGGRIGLLTVMTQTANISATGLPIIEGIQSSISMNNTWGGTDLTIAGQAGTATPLNPFLTFNCNTPPSVCYTNGGGGSGAEFDFHFDPGVSFRAVAGLLFVRVSAGTTFSQGAVADSTIQISDNATVAGHWLTNLQLNSRDSNWALDNINGQILNIEMGNDYVGHPANALHAFNVLNGTFSGDVLLTRNAALDGVGNLRQGTAYSTFAAASGLTIDATGYEGQDEGASVTVSTAGTQWPLTGQFYASDVCHGRYLVTLDGSGGVSAVTVYRRSYCPTNPGSTVTLIPDKSATQFRPTHATATGSTSGSSTTLSITGASATPSTNDILFGVGFVQPAFISSCGTFTAGAGSCTMNQAQTIATGTPIKFQTGTFSKVTNAYTQAGSGSPVVALGGTADVTVGASVARSATNSFSHPFGLMTAGSPTGTPAITTLPACVINSNASPPVLDCYIGGAWNHLTFTAGAS